MTRIGKLDEADCLISPRALKPSHFALVPGSATKYRVTKAGRAFIHPSLIDSSGCLKYFDFLVYLLSELKIFLTVPGSLPDGMTANADFKMCTNCGKEDGHFGKYQHCQDCLPGLAFTKAGPCMIIRDVDGTVISIDLIPLLPCPEKDPLVMFNLVSQCLVVATLHNWLNYFRKYVRSDTLLPEVQSGPTLPIDGFISFKLLHAHSNQDNFIMRPGQTLAMKNLQGKLKEAYCFLKALKTIMGADISSYGIKKVLLLEDLSRQTKTAKDSVELLHTVITHPHLKPTFEISFKGDYEITYKIYFLKWKQIMDENASRKSGNKTWYYKTIPLKLVHR